MLCAGTKVEDGNYLREGVDGQPQPQYVCGAAQPGAQFVQLEVWEPEMARWERSCKVCACSPARVRKAGDGGLTVAEDPCCGGRVQPKGSREIRTIPIW